MDKYGILLSNKNKLLIHMQLGNSQKYYAK